MHYRTKAMDGRWVASTESCKDRMGGCGGTFMMEQREFGRRRARKSARFLSADGSSASCAIVEMSDGGARLQLCGVAPSSEFTLLIPEDDIAVRCVVVHHADDELGVRYLAMPQRLSRLLTGSGSRFKRP